MRAVLPYTPETSVELGHGRAPAALVDVTRQMLLGLGLAALWLIVVDSLGASVGYVVSKAGASWGTTVAYGAGHVLGFGALLALWRSSTLRRRLECAANGTLPALDRARGVLLLIALMTAVRLAWVFLVPTEPTSDNVVYHGLAKRLAEQGIYGNEKRAYWPPGYPFFLAGVYAVFGPSWLVAKLANVVLAGLGDVLTWTAVRVHAGTRAAALALVLVVAWPWRTLHVDVLSYDALTVALVLASLALIPRRGRNLSARATWLRWVAAGVALGLAVLVRPTLVLIPLAVFGWLVVRGDGLRRAAGSTLVLGLAALVPIVPWSIRNCAALHAFVPLTTNAGGNFYNSWAPGGTGGFYKPAWQTLEAAAGADERKLSALGFAMGIDTLRSDPLHALRTAARKQVHYLGSDNWWLPVESYIAACDGHVRLGTGLKLVGHTLANAWFGLMLWLPLLMIRRVREVFARQPLAWFSLAVFASGLLVHTVFEAQARYHLIYTPFWSILIALLLEPRAATASGWSGRAGFDIKRHPAPAD